VSVRSSRSAPAGRRRPRPVLLVAAALVALVVAACGGADDAATPTEPPEEAVDLDVKPDPALILDAERGEPPAELQVEDLVVGEGAEATAGDTVVVQYVGVAWDSGEQFDASWDRGQPFAFPLGQGQVIQGWDQGVEGMREGGRRVLTIPSELAYGSRGAGDVIGPDETLVFVVDLLEVQAAG
jgi:peptidylprolyl isomerase